MDLPQTPDPQEDLREQLRKMQEMEAQRSRCLDFFGGRFRAAKSVDLTGYQMYISWNITTPELPYV